MVYSVETAFPFVTTPGDPETPFTRFTPLVPVSISFAAPLGPFDTSERLYRISVAGGLGTFFSGTLTETITTADAPGVVPEPAMWGLLVIGFGSAGAMMRRLRRVAPTRGSAS